MTLDSYANSTGLDSKRDFKDFVEKLGIIIESLGAFKGREGKKLNLSRLADHLNLSKQELENLIDLVLQFQDMFEGVFIDYRIIKKNERGSIYFTLKKRIVVIPEIIKLNVTQVNQLSDITYVFQHIRKGKGFNIDEKPSELVENVKNLMDSYPFLFDKNGGDLIYPSVICLEFGNQVRSYNKSNKQLSELKVNNHKFVVE